MKYSITGLNIGSVVGSLAFLNFTIFAEPGKWLFVRFGVGKAIGLYGELGLLWIVACAAVGAFLPALLRRSA